MSVAAVQLLAPGRNAGSICMSARLQSCRHTRECAPDEENWEWVPHFAETMPPDVTHGHLPVLRKALLPRRGLAFRTGAVVASHLVGRDSVSC